jgi:hypothetical protein
MQLQKAKAFRLDLVEKCVSDEEIRLRGEMLTLCLNSPTNCMRDKTGAPCISLDPQGVVNLLSQYGTLYRLATMKLTLTIAGLLGLASASPFSGHDTSNGLEGQ